MIELYQGDISNLEELDEGRKINIDNLNKVENKFPNSIEGSNSVCSI